MRLAAGASDDATGSSSTSNSSRRSEPTSSSLPPDADRSEFKEPMKSRRAAAAAAAAARGSRKGAQNWTGELLRELFKAIKQVLPIGAYHWDEVAEMFNKNTGREDDTARLKNKFMNLATARKPTGVNTKPTDVTEAKELYEMIEEKACLAEMGGDDRAGFDDAADALSLGDGGADETQALDGMDDLDLHDVPPPQDSPQLQFSQANVSSSSTSSSSSASPASSSRHVDSMLSAQSEGRCMPPARSFPSNRCTPTKRPRSVAAGSDLSTATETLSSSLAAVLADSSRQHKESMRQHRESMLLYSQQMERADERAREERQRADERAREERERSATQFALLLAAITGKAHAVAQ
jgi:hypothetical protein